MPVRTSLFDLSSQVALITGGASGIGKEIAKALVQHGAHVLIGSRTNDKVTEAVADLRRATETDEADPVEPIIEGVPLDVTADQSVEHAIKRCMDLFGRLDVLVNCAGIMIKKPTFDLTMAEFNAIHESHVTGSFRCCQAAGHLMREQHSGCIINLASVSSFCALTEVTAYASAKSAILGLTRQLATEWAKYGIRTNAIAPGFIPTDLNRKFLEGTDRGRRILEKTPMGRFGTADEIAGAAVFLAGKAGSFVNGTTIIVDGGYIGTGIGDSVAPWAQAE
jgi:NAD(P)-dependent dehydrogenase (short-subunit alcohol dehydrogenase family)